MKIKEKLIFLLKLSVGLGIVLWMVYNGNLKLDKLSQLFHPFIVVSLIAIIFLIVFFQSIRLKFILQARKFETKTAYLFYMNVLGQFFNFIAPGGVGGDLFKGYFLSKKYEIKKLSAYGTLFLDRGLGLISLSFLGIIGGLINYQTLISTGTEMYGLVFMVLVLAFLFYLYLSKFEIKRIAAFSSLNKVFQLMRDFQTSDYFKIFCFSLLSQISMILFFMATLYFLDIKLESPHLLLFIFPLGTLFAVLPISPGGLGVGQIAFYYFFKIYYPEQADLGPLLISAMQIMQFASGFIAYLLFLYRKDHSIKESLRPFS